MFKITLTPKAIEQLEKLEKNKSLKKRFKAVKKALRFLSSNPKHPSLNTHEISTLSTQVGKKIFEAYAENHTPGAYRIFWYYGDNKKEITIIAIIPHP